MKFKMLICLMLAILMLTSTCIVSCNLDGDGDIQDVIDNIAKNEHEHGWDNWFFDYTETDVLVVCSVCDEVVESHPVSQGLEIKDGVLLGVRTCTDSLIVVPNGVTIIGDSALKNSKDLVGILLPNTLTVIGPSAFKNCMSLKVVNIPEGVKLIDRSAFKNCNELYGVLLPESLAYLGKECFADCPILLTLYYKGNQNEWDNVGKHEDWDNNTNHDNPEHKDWGKDCEHEWSKWSIIKSYFCYTEGEVQRVCSKCNKVEREKRQRVHECSNDPKEQVTFVMAEPTCFAKGIDGILCLCGEDVCAYNETSIGHKTTVSIEGDTLTIFCQNCNENVLVTNYAGYSEGLDIQGGIVCGIGSCTDKNIVIPPYYNGYIVTEIEPYAFQNSDIISVTIPDTVINIGTSAFEFCESLKAVKMGNNVQFIDRRAFVGCDNLESIILSEQLRYIAEDAFPSISKSQYNVWNNGIYLGNDDNPYMMLIGIDNKEVASFEIHKDTKFLANNSLANLFWNMPELQSISISEDNEYFKTFDAVLYSKDGTNLVAYPSGKSNSEFTVPNGVTKISKFAFNHASNLRKINLPNTITCIDTGAFLSCKVEAINIPEGVEIIESYAFSQTQIKSLILPEGIKVIEYMAFLNCYKMGEIQIPESLSIIGSEAFSGCSSIYEVRYAGTQKQWYDITKEYGWDSDVENYAIQYGDGTVGGTHTHIFSNWMTVNKPTETETGLEERYCSCGEKETREIPTLSHVHTVEEWTVTKEATETENGLKEGICTECGREVKEVIATVNQFLEYELNEDGQSYSVVGLGNWVDPELVIPDTYNGLPITIIGMGAFANSDSLESVYISDSVECVDARAFAGCKNLKTVRMGANVKILGEQAFNYCLSLEKIELNNKLETIGALAFYGGIRLKEIIIPDSVLSIGEQAFQSCAFEKVYIGSSVSSISDTAFYGCKYLSVIEVSEQNNHYTTIDGVLYTKDETTLILCPGSMQVDSIKMPSTLTTVNDYSFSSNETLPAYIYFEGTPEQWNAIVWETNWHSGSSMPHFYIVFPDGSYIYQ